MELGNVPFNSRDIRPDRVEAVKYYQSLVDLFDIACLTDADVSGVYRNGKGYRVNYLKAGLEEYIEADYVILSTGFCSLFFELTFHLPHCLFIETGDYPSEA